MSNLDLEDLKNYKKCYECGTLYDMCKHYDCPFCTLLSELGYHLFDYSYGGEKKLVKMEL